MGLLLWSIVTKQQPREPEISFSRFVQAVEEGRVAEVVIQGKSIRGRYRAEQGDPPEAGQGQGFKTFAPDDPELVRTLREKGVEIEARPEDAEPWYFVALVQWAPMLLLIGVWVFFMRQMQMGGGKAMSFGKSRAKLLSENTHKVTFNDVAGIDEAKEELEEIIAFLKDPKKFTKLGGRIPKGVLLVGPPGTGKTLLARAIAGEAGVPFFSISGSDFVEMFVGVGASRVRDLFVQGKKNAPCIIFIDEIDAVGRHRGAGLGGGHDEREQTLNQLLVEMDGFETNEGVILIAATNRPDVLDPALLRPGRFDRRVVVPRPDVKGREGILKVHARRVPLADNVNIELLARQTPGFAGADLENLVNEAALLAARRNKDKVDMSDFELAKDKVLMGSERRSMIISFEERRNTAYHEAGHALVAKLIPGADPVHKVTIIPRGMALGLTQQVPIDDRHTYSADFLQNQLAILFGGRAGEELVLGHMTTGAGNDIEKATEMARKMVCEWGMSEKLGPMTFGKKEEEIFLGRDFTQRVDYSESTAVQIDGEVRRIVMEAYERAKILLRRNLEALHKMAEALLEREVLDGPEIDAILQQYGSQNGSLGTAAAATA
jgi:cell division protease FtsH